MTRNQHLMVLERIWLTLWPLAAAGDERATRNCARVIERRAMLLGLR
jgi:hypothetical protein